MSLKKNIQFRIDGIKIDQFAILSDTLPTNIEGIGMETEVGFAVNQETQDVIVHFKIDYIKQENDVKDICLLLQLSCAFGIEPNDWASLQQDGKITVPRHLLAHLAMHTFGTARGILFSKTEGTIWNSFVLPPTNVDSMITNDLVVE